MKSLLRYLNDYKKETVLAPLFKMLEASFELFVPLVMAAIIDRGIKTGDKSYIIRMGLILLLLAVIGLVCSITAQYFSAKAATGFAAKLKRALFAHIQTFSYSELDTLGTSAMITRLTSDANQVQSGVNMVLRLFLRSPFIVFGAMVMAFTIDAEAALIFVIAIPLLAVVVFGIMLISIPLYQKVQQRLEIILGKTRENLSGVRVIRAFHTEEQEQQAFTQAHESLTKVQLFVGKVSALMNPVTLLIVNAAIIALIWTGAWKVDGGVLTQGQVVALVNYMSQILVELVKLANLIILVTKAAASAKRIEHVFSVGSTMESGEVILDTASEYALEMEKAGLCYQGAGAESLSNLSLRVKKGETVGIIGGTGSGKTSFVNLIPRFYDATAGKVKVFGREVSEYTLDSLRNAVGIVPQKSVLFRGTIESNLRFGQEDATTEELWEALRLAQAEDFVAEKEGKLQAEVLQGGKNFSGGQRQRLTIARALVRKPQILILDDSASALDYATDARLRMAIRQMEQEPTVFIVSQRAASVMHADQIVVLEDGRISGIGTHEQLLKRCMVYQEIYASQFPDEREGRNLNHGEE